MSILRTEFGLNPVYAKTIAQAERSVNGNGIDVHLGGGDYESLGAIILASGCVDLPQWYDDPSSFEFSNNPDILQTAIETMLPKQFIAFVKKKIPPLYKHLQELLDYTAYNPEHGFNNHTFPLHIDPLMQWLEKLIPDIQKTGLYTTRDINAGILGIALHDFGNIAGRATHGFNTILLMEKIFGPIDKHSYPDVYRALEATGWHDEKVSMPEINRILGLAMEGQFLDVANAAQDSNFLERVAESFDPATSFLVFLDKIDMGRARAVNTREQSHEALIEDPHFLANVGWQSPSIEIVERDDEMVLSIQWIFNHFPDQNLVVAGSNDVPASGYLIPTKNGHEIRMPDPIHEKFTKVIDVHSSYLAQMYDLALGLYSPRLNLAAVHGLRLFPQCDRVEFSFVDSQPTFWRTDPNSNGKKAKVEITNDPRIITIRRHRLLQDLKMMSVAAGQAQNRMNKINYKTRFPKSTGITIYES